MGIQHRNYEHVYIGNAHNFNANDLPEETDTIEPHNTHGVLQYTVTNIWETGRHK